jgi:arylsulfatase A-like enzyme
LVVTPAGFTRPIWTLPLDSTSSAQAPRLPNYSGMISLIDPNVGRILAALADLGLARDTLLVCSSMPPTMASGSATTACT